MMLFFEKKSSALIPHACKERGAAAVEFAVIIPVLVIFLFGIIELSILLFDNAMVNHSVRVGARTGALFKASYSPTKNIAAAEQVTSWLCQNNLIKFGGPSYAPGTYLEFLSADGSTIFSTQSLFDSNIKQGDAFRVRLNQSYPYTFGVLLNFLGISPVNLNTEVLVRRE